MNLAEYIKGFLGIIAIIFFGIGIVVWKFRVIGQKSSTTGCPTQSGNSQAVGQMTSNTAFDTISIKNISNHEYLRVSIE